jgi:uncharacterized protein YxeA
MKKIFIALLLVAAATAAFFFLRNKNAASARNAFDKELIIGKWKPVIRDSVNTDMKGYQFDFQKEGKFLEAKDSLAADTAYYEWGKDGRLIFSDKREDSVNKIFLVLKLTKDSLELKAKDSVETTFLRVIN